MGAPMRQERFEPDGLVAAPCRYGASRIPFRGPAKQLNQPYLACIGGNDTYGKYIPTPFPDMIEKALGQTCVNLGCMNGGIDAFADDPAILRLCRGASWTIVQVMGANQLSNRFYAVHPRRNDRFLRAAPALRDLYPEVDFTMFTFTRHLLGCLYTTSPVRFEIVVHELRQAWVARMGRLLAGVGKNCILLWFSAEPLSDCHWSGRPGLLKVDPLFVTATMIDRLRSQVQGLVVVNPSAAALALGTAGMQVLPSQAAMADNLLGVASHAEAATALISALTPLHL